ncbi:hypothetical protein CO038_01765 [Candidatus Pacearchaeota archaeon CG_4_9_14_0_2_um_filter_39_13]|nr:hypothetical protein [Candidatus Pacearchaeota archaeon]PJC44856.1 MAG: hypothetical protein CO038_01765 [Candidatus Pacearchaeota archaeon CG_4_9_14_0_2_um_filter_39_13]
MINQRGVKILSLVLLLSFATTLFSGIASAQNELKDNAVIGPIVDLFTFQTELGVDIGVTKWLFIILLSLLIWSVLEGSGIIKQNAVRWVISIIVAFLGVSYFTVDEVIATLQTYQALGLTLLFLFPLLILMTFTWRIVAHFQSPGAVVFQWFMWIVYGIFLVYRFLVDYPLLSVTTRWIFGIVGILTLIMIFGNRWIRGMLGAELVRSEIDNALNTEQRAAALTRARSDAARAEGASP